LSWQVPATPCYKREPVPEFILSMFAVVRVFCQSRSDTAIEVLALRQQVAVPKRKRPCPALKTPSTGCSGRKFRRLWSRWSDVLVIVKPETAISWHRAGFRLYWRWRSRRRGGRPKVTDEIRGLIRRLAEENRDWGVPKLDGELLKLGFVASERTVARYLRKIRRRGDPSKRWLAFLQNHRERTGVAQPLREALPEAGPYRYVILDRDSKFNATVIAF